MRSFSCRTIVPIFAATVCVTLGCAKDDQGSGSTIDFAGSPATSTGGGGGALGSGSSPGSVTSSGGAAPIVVPIDMTDSSDDPVDACTSTQSTATPQPPVLAFLIDTSLSMTEAPSGAAPGTPDKWTSTRDALIQAFTDMAEGTGTGLIYYPNVNATGFGTPGGGFGTPGGGFGMGGSRGFPGAGGAGGATGFPGGAGAPATTGSGGATSNTMCIDKQVAVPIAPLTAMQRQAVLTSLRSKMPNGNTPTHDAYQFALQTLEASTLAGSKYVVLVTDGSPTFSLGCIGDGITAVDAGPIIMEAATALQHGIKTFVIGSPGSEAARESLSQIATQGGTALAGCSDAGPNYCHFDMTTAPDLSAALNAAFQAITGQIISCTYNIPATGGGDELDLTKINVNYTTGAGETTLIPRDASTTACTQGWQFSADQTQIVLCPDTCSQVKADQGAKVDVLFGCKTVTR